jgi:hypothetical protein
VRLVFTISNAREQAADVDLMFSCVTAARTVTVPARGGTGILRFGDWNLNLLRSDEDGAPVDTLDRFSPGVDSWDDFGSFDGSAEYLSFSWIGKRAPAGGSLELATIFGLGTPPVFASRPASISPPPRQTARATPSRTASLSRLPEMSEATANASPPAFGRSKVSTGAVAGLAVAVVAVVGIAVAAVCCLVRRTGPKPVDEMQDELVDQRPLEGLYT